MNVRRSISHRFMPLANRHLDLTEEIRRRELDDLQPNGRHLIWVYPGSLRESLDAATWLTTSRELCEMGWRVTLIDVGPDGEHEIQGFPVHEISRPDIYLFKQLIYHLRILGHVMRHWDDTYAVLFHEMSGPWMMLLKLMRPFKGKPYPLLAMDTRTLAMVPPDKETLRDKLRRYFYGLSNRLTNRWADGRLVITDRMGEVLEVPRDKLWGVWPSGVDLDQFTDAAGDRRWPEGDEPIEVIHTGSQHYERNLMALSRAVVRANEEGMRFRLRLVGQGLETEDLKAYAAQVGGDTISVEPPIPHEQMPRLLAEVHVGTMPFPDEEKFRVSSHIKLFEYMAAGLPVVATRIESHTRVIKDADSAIWAEGASEDDLLQALRELWRTRDTLPEKSRQAVEASREWSWAASAKKLSDALLRHGTAPEAS